MIATNTIDDDYFFSIEEFLVEPRFAAKLILIKLGVFFAFFQ